MCVGAGPVTYGGAIGIKIAVRGNMGVTRTLWLVEYQAHHHMVESCKMTSGTTARRHGLEI